MDNRIKELREELNIRQIDLSKATGIDQRTISNYETGKTSPDAFALIKFADFFNVSVDYLLKRTDDVEFTPRKIIPKEKRITELIDKIQFDLDKIKNLCK